MRASQISSSEGKESASQHNEIDFGALQAILQKHLGAYNTYVETALNRGPGLYHAKPCSFDFDCSPTLPREGTELMGLAHGGDVSDSADPLVFHDQKGRNPARGTHDPDSAIASPADGVLPQQVFSMLPPEGEVLSAEHGGGEAGREQGKQLAKSSNNAIGQGETGREQGGEPANSSSNSTGQGEAGKEQGVEQANSTSSSTGRGGAGREQGEEQANSSSNAVRNFCNIDRRGEAGTEQRKHQAKSSSNAMVVSLIEAMRRRSPVKETPACEPKADALLLERDYAVFQNVLDNNTVEVSSTCTSFTYFVG
jgi:hypothetical protein